MDIYYLYEQYKCRYTQLDGMFTQSAAEGKQSSRVYRVYTPRIGGTVKPDPPKSVQQTAHLHPIDFTIKVIHFEPPRSRYLNSEQQTLISP